MAWACVYVARMTAAQQHARPLTLESFRTHILCRQTLVGIPRDDAAARKGRAAAAAAGLVVGGRGGPGAAPARGDRPRGLVARVRVPCDCLHAEEYATPFVDQRFALPRAPPPHRTTPYPTHPTAPPLRSARAGRRPLGLCPRPAAWALPAADGRVRPLASVARCVCVCVCVCMCVHPLVGPLSDYTELEPTLFPPPPLTPLQGPRVAPPGWGEPGSSSRSRSGRGRGGALFMQSKDYYEILGVSRSATKQVRAVMR